MKKPKKLKPLPPPENRRKTGVSKLRGGVDPAIGKPTQFKPGESGNPSGRPKSKPITDAIEAAILKDPKLAERIAVHALKHATTNLGWFVEVRDMLDGKPDGKPSGSSDDPVNFNLNVNFKDAAQGKIL